MICIFPYFCPYAESTREIREIFKSVQLFRNRPAGNAECAWQFQTSVRSQADKGDFLVICRDFFGSVQMIIFIIHSVFVLYFLVEIAMVKFTILHPAFKLFFSGGFQYFSQSIAKINNPYFLSLGRSDDVYMFCAIIADTSFNGQSLFFKIDVLPCRSASFTDTKSRIVCNLDWQNCRWILYFEVFHQFLIIFVGNRLYAFFCFII